jgi:hypothetical protein
VGIGGMLLDGLRMARIALFEEIRYAHVFLPFLIYSSDSGPGIACTPKFGAFHKKAKIGLGHLSRDGGNEKDAVGALIERD